MNNSPGEANLAALLKSPEFQTMFTERASAHGDIGIELVDSADQQISMRLPFNNALTRSKTNPSLHPGAVMTVIDSAMGLAVMMNLSEPSSLATLELRYDELREPQPHSDLMITAQCESIDDRIAYLTASAVDGEGEFARAVGRFILTGAASGFLEQAYAMLAERQLQAGIADDV